MTIDLGTDELIVQDRVLEGVQLEIPDTVLANDILRYDLARAFLDDAFTGLRAGDTERWERGLVTVERLIHAGERIDAAEPF